MARWLAIDQFHGQRESVNSGNACRISPKICLFLVNAWDGSQ